MTRLFTGFICAGAFLWQGCAGCSNSGRNAARVEVMRRQISGRNEVLPPSHDVSLINDDSERSVSDLYKILAPSVFTVYSFRDEDDVQQGSGFLLSNRGIGVSNAHVFVDGGEHVAEFVSGATQVLTILELNRAKDYAVFRIDGAITAQPLAVSAQIPAVGDDVFAIGSPLGLKNTLSKGIVSNLHMDQEAMIQTTAAITHGSSGGPLFNSDGEVVGVTTSGFDEGNLNFAIPIREIPWTAY